MFRNSAHLFGSRVALLLALTVLVLGTVFMAGAQGGGTLRVGINAPVTLDPALGSGDSEVMLNRSIYDYLVEIRPDGTLAPNLATSWDVSDDGLTYTFNLAEGVTFHDGSPFTAADVVFTFNRLVALESSAIGLLGTDFEAEAVDDSTVVFTLPAVNADFLFGVGSRFAAILQDSTDEPNMVGEGDNPYASFNGTGPFVLSAFSQGESATLVKNENYWREDQPLVNTLEFVYIDDPVAQIDAIRSGAVDVIFRIPLDEVDQLDGVEGINVLEQASNLHPVVRIRADEGHLGEDVRIRQAFKLATDRQGINDLLLDGRGAVGNNDPIGPVFGPFFNDSLEDPGYDPAAACELIAETGAERVNTTLYAVDAFNYADLATVLQQQWAEGCIDVEILVRPENVYYGDNEWMDVDLGITGWGPRVIPQAYLTEAYISEGPFNESHWSNAEIDRLTAEASATPDIEARSAIYHQISEIFAEEGPIIIPFFMPVIAAASENVEGLEIHPFSGRTDFRTVSISG